MTARTFDEPPDYDPWDGPVPSGPPDDLPGLLDRAVGALVSGADKIVRHNPRWQDLPELLTDDELRVCLAFMAPALSKRT